MEMEQEAQISTWLNKNWAVMIEEKNVAQGNFQLTRNIQDQDSKPDLTNKLTYDDLLQLFSWLPVKDRITVRQVCHSWRVAAQDKCLFKDYIIRLTEDNNENIIKLMPAVKYLCGCTNISLLNVILEYMDDVSIMNIEFEPPISSSQAARVLEKYPELWSITLCSCRPDILESLEKLKASKHLKQILFTCLSHNLCECDPTYPSSFMKTFTDCNNFPGLMALNISDNIDFRVALLKDPSFRDIVVEIIMKRCHQLLSLKLDVSYCESSSILNVMSSCVNLQVLSLSIIPADTCVNIERMTQLMALRIHAMREDKMFLATLHISLVNGSWSHLTEVSLLVCTSDEYDASILKAITDNVKQIKILKYMDLSHVTDEHELENIGSLKKLEDLDVRGVNNISEKGIGYLSGCDSLKVLELYPHSSEIHSHDPCITKMLLKLNNLMNVIIKDDTARNDEENRNIDIAFKSRQEIKEHISEHEHEC